MTNNDIIRRLRYALDLSDSELLAAFALAGSAVGAEELDLYLRKEEDEGYAECPDDVMEAFLAGFIAQRRGPRNAGADGGPASAKARKPKLDNNAILRSIRIALELRDEDLIAIMRAANVAVSKSEVSALFRKKDHPNFRPCGDQFLRYFLNGLTTTRRSRRGPSDIS